MDRCRLLHLLDSYLENRLNDAERGELERELTASRQACRLFWEYTHQHALVGELLAETHGLELARQEKRLGPSRNGRRVAAAGALFAVAAAAAVASFFFRPGAAPEPRPAADPGPVLARLEETEGDVYVVSGAGRVRAEAGQDLFAGHEIQTRGEGGFAVVQYPDATRLEMGADSTLRLLPETADAGRTAGDPSKMLYLSEGVVTADVARQPDGRPLLLKTPCASVLGPGAHFFAAATPEATRVELETGNVQLAPMGAGPAVQVEAGSYAVASAHGEAPTPRPLPLRLTEVKPALQTGKSFPSAAFSADGGLFAAPAGEGVVKVWDTAARQPRIVLHPPGAAASALAFSADGKTLAVACPDKAAKRSRVTVFDVATGEERAGFTGLAEAFALTFSPDGRRLAAGGSDGKRQPDFKLWDLPSGQEEAIPPQAVPQGGKWRGVRCLTFSPDGGLLALGGRDGIVRLLDLAGGKEMTLLRGGAAAVGCVAFSPDGATLAAGGGAKDKTVRLWNLATGQERAALPSPSGAVYSVCFSPDGETLAAGCDGGVGRLWDAADGMEKATVQAHRRPVCCVAFTADGRTLAAAGREGVVKFWDVGEDDLN